MRGYVAAQLSDPHAVLVLIRPGMSGRALRPPGVQRHDTGAAGRVENSQVAVCLTHAGRGRPRPDRPAVYLPGHGRQPGQACGSRNPGRSGVRNRARLRRPDDQRRAGRGHAPARVSSDEMHDTDVELRARLERSRIGHVLAVAKDHHVTTAAAVASALDRQALSGIARELAQSDPELANCLRRLPASRTGCHRQTYRFVGEL